MLLGREAEGVVGAVGAGRWCARECRTNDSGEGEEGRSSGGQGFHSDGACHHFWRYSFC